MIVAACSPKLAIGDSAEISCRTDRDCPDRMSCTEVPVDFGSTQSRCVVAFTPDTAPPEVLQTSAESETSVVVVLSEIVGPKNLVEDVAGYSLSLGDTPVAISSAELRIDRQSILLHTEPQIGQYDYTLVLPPLSDISGNSMEADSRSVSFRGFGSSPDTTAPILYTPANGSQFLSAAVPRLTWSPRSGSPNHEVQIVTDPNDPSGSLIFDKVIDVTEWPTDTTLHPGDVLGLQPVDYYWRVKSEFSPWSVWFRFSVEDPDAIFVDSAATAAFETGNRSSPYHTLTAALLHLASTPDAGPRQVRLAAGSYEEHVTVSQTASIAGGFDPASDWARGTTPSVLSGPSSTPEAMLVSLAPGSSIEDMRIEASSEPFYSSAALRVYASDDVTLARLDLQGGSGIEVAGLYVVSSDHLSLADSTVLGTTDPNAFFPRGIAIKDAMDFVIERATVFPSPEGGTQITQCIRVDVSQGRIADSTISGGSGVNTSAISISDSTVTVQGNTITTARTDGTSGFGVGVVVCETPETNIVDNVIITEGVNGWADGTYELNGCNTGLGAKSVLIANNTFVMRNAVAQSAIAWPTEMADIRNNLFVFDSTAVSPPNTITIAEDNRSEGTQRNNPSLGYNAFTAGATDVYRDATSQGMALCTWPSAGALDDFLSTCGVNGNPVTTSSILGNVALIQDSSALFVDAAADDFRPSATSQAQGVGENLTSLYSGRGLPVLDRGGNPRPATGNWTAGAYEQ